MATSKIFLRPSEGSNIYLLGEYENVGQLDAAYPPLEGQFLGPQGKIPLALVGATGKSITIELKSGHGQCSLSQRAVREALLRAGVEW